MDYSLPGSSVHGIFQAKILEWVAISFSRRSSQPRDRTQVSRFVGRRFTIWTLDLLTKPRAASSSLGGGQEQTFRSMEQNREPSDKPIYLRTSLVAQMVKRLPTMRETRVQSLGWEDLLEKEMATHSSILAWKIPRTEELGGLQSIG